MDVVEALIKVGRPEILKVASADSCVLSTRVAIETLAYFQIEAKPVACEVMVWNVEFARGALSGKIDLAKPWTEQTLPEGAHSLGIGMDDGELRGRHLVTWMKGFTRDYVLDLSIDQASRPERGIVLEPMVFPITPEWLAGDVWARVGDREDVVVMYHARPLTPHWWTRTPNWGSRDARRRRDIVARVIRVTDKFP